MSRHTYRSIRGAILQRVESGEWPPGSLIPGEAELAGEYSCSRTTVNRALQALADSGIVERRRRAGTRVSETPIRRARLEIPMVRREVEALGKTYAHRLLKRETPAAPGDVLTRMGLRRNARLLHLETLHLASGEPYMFEDRWVNIAAVPAILNAPLDEISANEWLIGEVPFSRGDIGFSAAAAGSPEAEFLKVEPGAPLFIVERRTWLGETSITSLRMHYPPGYRLTSAL